MEKLRGQIESDNISYGIYLNGAPVAAPTVDAIILATALQYEGGHTLVFDHTAVYAQTFGNYHALVIDANYLLNDDTSYYPYIFVMIGLFVLMLLIITIINRILTRNIINRIATPLETLSYGVDQLHSGNLSFRLEYLREDEFSPVCAVFNNMARQLEIMVDARQKDEESRRELIAGISHDLRTPLSSIKASLEGIEKGVANTKEKQQKYLDIVSSKTKDLEHIIGQLFLFSKLDVGEFPMNLKPIDIGDTIADLVDEYGPEYEDKGLLIELTENVRDTIVNADVVWLRNVLVNLLENSLKYGATERQRVRVGCQKSRDNVEITVVDNGPGVSADVLRKLFDVFYRTDPSRNTKGSGLGLAITAKIVQRMGGEICAESPPGGGLAIIISLPVIQKEG